MRRYFYCLCAIAIISCSNTAQNIHANADALSQTTNGSSANHLSFKINGKLWEADHEIFGAFHPKGYNNAIIISGTKGPKNKDEQAFNINLYNTIGPAQINIQNGNADNNVAQLANISPENFLYGSMMGFDMKVKIVKANKTPNVIEATFEGTLKGNAGDVLQITEGKFYYQE